MPCLCGNKVDRLEKVLKVHCIICKQFMHCNCYKIKPSEIDLIKIGFKCKNCLTIRRSSISGSPVVEDIAVKVNEPVSNNVVVANTEAVAVVAASKDMLSIANENLNALSSADTGAVISNGGSATDNSNNSNTASKNDCQTFPNRNICLDDICKELVIIKHNNEYLKNIILSLRDDNIVLKSNNADLCKQVSLLRNDNCKLSSKVDELLTSVKALEIESLAKMNKLSTSKNNNNNNNNSNGKQKSFSDVVSSAVVAVPKHDIHINNAFVVADHDNPNNNNAVVSNDKQKSLSDVIPSAVVSVPKNVSLHNNNAFVAAVDGVLPKKISLNDAVVVADIAVHNEVENITDGFAVAAQVNSGWETINSRKSNKNKFRRVVGANVNDELQTIEKTKWIHISSFANSVEPFEIINYLVKHTNIDVKHFTCYKLIKKDANVKDLKYVNFKLGISSSYYESMFNADIWPANVSVRPFNFLESQLKPKL